MSESEAIADSKRCYSCSESIAAKALRCRFCGAGQPGDGVTEPPCERCGAVVVVTAFQRRSGGMTLLAVILILGGILGLPLFGMGAIGIVGGCLIIGIVKNEKVEIIRCIGCKAARPHRLAPFYRL